jgi:hypothetical protein
MCSVQRIRDLRPVLQHLLQRQRPLLQTFRKCLPLHTLHHQILDPIVGSNIVQSTNVRMIQLGNGFRFSLKSLLASHISRKLLGPGLAWPVFPHC